MLYNGNYIMFLSRNKDNNTQEIIGSDGISPTDGRCRNYTLMKEGYRRYVQQRNVLGYACGFRIYRRGIPVYERVFNQTLREYYEGGICLNG